MVTETPALTAGPGNWSEFSSAVENARATETATETRNSPATGQGTPSPEIPAHILAAAKQVSDTPTVLWDVDGLRAHAAELQRVFASHGIALSVAVKAAPVVEVLAEFAALGIAADIASIGELDTARMAGFERISASGPAFRPAHAGAMAGAGVAFDAQSPAQAGRFADEAGARAMGLRLRTPLPDSLCSPTSHGANSRFGIGLDAGFVDWLRERPVRVPRIRVHTGESTVDTLSFRARYAQLAARLLGDVGEINLGGGFLALSRDLTALDAALAPVAELFGHDGPPYRLSAEPGNGLLADFAYLVTEVLDARPAGRSAVVTVDASAWNLAPWARCSFSVLGEETTPYHGLVHGASLYEEDYFLPSFAAAPSGVVPAVGSRMLATSFGAYTLANARRFAGLELPAQCLVTDRSVTPIGR